MPVTEKDGKYFVKDEEFDTEEKANAAYMSYLDKAFGVDSATKKPLKKTKKSLDKK